MSFGKKKSKAPKVQIAAPPQIQQVEIRSPIGDVFRSRQEGNTQINETELGEFSSLLGERSQQGLLDEVSGLGKTDAQRRQDIQERASDLFKTQAQGINRDADDQLSRARSLLSNRFGGTFNSTFGNDYLSRLENNRLVELSDARRRSNLLAEDLTQSDQDSRIRRLGVFQGLLNNIVAQAQGAAQTGGGILANENQRATQLAVSRAQMIQNAYTRGEQLDIQRRQNSLASVGLGLASDFGSGIIGAIL